MSIKLADTRDIGTIEDAKQLMAEIRRLTCERQVIVARCEKQVAGLTRQADHETAPIDRELQTLCDRLRTFILARNELFESPRMIKTSDGKFGLHAVSNVEIFDEDKALDAIFDRGYDDCVKRRVAFDKNAIAKRLRAGESIPGCRIAEGVRASCEVSRALIKQAEAAVLEED